MIHSIKVSLPHKKWCLRFKFDRTAVKDILFPPQTESRPTKKRRVSGDLPPTDDAPKRDVVFEQERRYVTFRLEQPDQTSRQSSQPAAVHVNGGKRKQQDTTASAVPKRTYSVLFEPKSAKVTIKNIGKAEAKEHLRMLELRDALQKEGEQERLFGTVLKGPPDDSVSETRAQEKGKEAPGARRGPSGVWLKGVREEDVEFTPTGVCVWVNRNVWFCRADSWTLR